MLIKLSEPLETKRLFIRQFTKEDYENLVNKVNTEFPNEIYPVFSYYKERNVVCFLSELRDEPIIIGYIFLRTFEKVKALECHYSLFPDYIGNGYAIEALRKVFEYIFANYDIIKILAFVEQGNTRGWKVAERSGMMYMGDILHEGQDSKVMYFLLNKRDYINQMQS